MERPRQGQRHAIVRLQVLHNGDLFVAGGEYGTGGDAGEAYNPVTNVWTKLPTNSFGNFSDSESQLLPNGTVQDSVRWPPISF